MLDDINDKLQALELRKKAFTQCLQTSRIVAISNQKLDQSKYYKSLMMEHTSKEKKQLTPLEKLKNIQSKMKNRPSSARFEDQEITIKAFTLDLMSKVNENELKKKLFGKYKQKVINKDLISNILEKKSSQNPETDKQKVHPRKQNQIRNRKIQQMQSKIQSRFDCIVYGQKPKIRSIQLIQKKNIKYNRNRLHFSKKKTLQKHQILCPEFPQNTKYQRDEKINNLLSSPKQKDLQNVNSKNSVKKRRIISSNLFKRQNNHHDFQQQIKPWENKNMDWSLESPL